MSLSPLVERMIQAFCRLPGVGPKSARRMVVHLLQRNRKDGSALVDALREALEAVGHCSRCRMLSESPQCNLCSDARRDATQLCVVESPMDVLVLEQVGGYRGVYFVLMGHLSPVDGIGPEELGVAQLVKQVREGVCKEIILATSATAEGNATAYYVAERLRGLELRMSRIAHGIPLGGELEYVDGVTLAHAIRERQALH